MNYQQIIEHGNRVLSLNNVKSSRLDSELILSKILNKNREQILINLKDELNQNQIDKYDFYLSRRRQKEPMAYILGYKYFVKLFLPVSK